MNRLSRLVFIVLACVLLSVPAAGGAAAQQKSTSQTLSVPASKKTTPKKPLQQKAVPQKTKTATQKQATGKQALPFVTGIRTGMNGTKTRIVIETETPVTFRAFMLADPVRLIVDVPQARWKTAQNKGLTTALVKGYRSGVLDNGLTRIAFDLRRTAVIASAFNLPPAGTNLHRVVIDLEPSSQNMFDARVKKTEGDGDIVANVAAGSSAVTQAEPETASSGALPVPYEGIALPQRKPDFQQNAQSADYRGAANAGSTAPAPRKKDKYVVVLDAGHGGADPGAIGVGGVLEKNITLAVARELRRQLEETGRYRVVMTRDRDVYIPLRGRVDISRQKGGDIFISIHADKVDRSHTRGASIYTLSATASDAETARLAEQENNAGVVAGVDLSSESHDVAGILLDLSMREKMNESNLFAGYLRESLKRESVQLLPNSHRSAGFAVLKAPDVPSVLIETGFLSNAQDAKLLNSSEFHRKIARGIVGGIDAFFVKMASLQGF